MRATAHKEGSCWPSHGHWDQQRSGTTRPRPLDSFNPATGELVGSVPTITPTGAIDRGDVAGVQPFWPAVARVSRSLLAARGAGAAGPRRDADLTLVSRQARLECNESAPPIDAFTGGRQCRGIWATSRSRTRISCSTEEEQVRLGLSGSWA